MWSYGGFIWFDFSVTIKIYSNLTTEDGFGPFVTQTKKHGLVLPAEIDLELVMEVVEVVNPLSDSFLEFYIFGLGLVTFSG